jgi:hypothetical protein
MYPQTRAVAAVDHESTPPATVHKAVTSTVAPPQAGSIFPARTSAVLSELRQPVAGNPQAAAT